MWAPQYLSIRVSMRQVVNGTIGRAMRGRVAVCGRAMGIVLGLRVCRINNQGVDLCLSVLLVLYKLRSCSRFRWSVAINIG